MASVEPFLRWAGGKRWLAKTIAPLLRSRLKEGGHYYEPFLGSGAMFFSADPERAVLSDLNEELIITFRQVASGAEQITQALSQLGFGERLYYKIRNWRPQSDFDRAVRFIYLNRNCYGGLYRENRAGKFNVPYGGGSRSHKKLLAEDILVKASQPLQRDCVKMRICDFEESFREAGSGDVVYCDPTYRTVTRSSFDRYGKVIFGWDDQERLAKCCQQAYERGALVILSNSTCNGVKALYGDVPVIRVARKKGLGPPETTSLRTEYLFILDPMESREYWANLGESHNGDNRGQIIGGRPHFSRGAGSI